LAYSFRVPWREQSPAMRIVVVAAVAVWSAGVASLLAIGYIETTALSQPSVADEVYRNPHHLKSVVRFLTDRQERIHSIAFLMFWVSWALFAVLFFSLKRLQNRAEKRRLERLLAKEEK
jgi:hypothetical protein